MFLQAEIDQTDIVATAWHKSKTLHPRQTLHKGCIEDVESDDHDTIRGNTISTGSAPTRKPMSTCGTVPCVPQWVKQLRLKD